MRVERDPDFARKVLAEGDVDVLVRLAEPAADRARALAPDDPDTPGSSIGDAIEVVGDRDRRGVPVALINANDWKSNFHEAGTSKMDPHPFLRPGVEQEIGPLHGDDGDDA